MHVKDVVINNVFIQSKEGIDIQESTGIELNNVSVYTNTSNPLVYVLNSDKVNINNLKYAEPNSFFLRAEGPRSKNVLFKNTNFDKIKSKTEIGFGADAKTILIK